MSITSQLWQLSFLWPWPYTTLFPLYLCKTLLWSPLSEVHCFRMAPCNFSHCALWFLLSTASNTLFSPTLWFLLHWQVTMSFFTCHLSHFQTSRVCFLSQHIIRFERVLRKDSQSYTNYLPSFKLFPRHPKEANASTLNYHGQGCFSFGYLFFSALHASASALAFVQRSAQGTTVLWQQIPWATGMLKKIINKYEINMKYKAWEQVTLSHLPHTTTRLDIKATRKNPNLCCHANTRNSRKKSNQSVSTLYPSQSCIYQSFPAFLCVL